MLPRFFRGQSPKLPTGLYIASAVGAVALYMMLPRRGYNPRKFGALLGGITLGLLWLHLADRYLPAAANRGIPGAAMAYYYIFSGVAIGAAGRVITHRKPVYAALWFVMVVLASSGLLIVLSAEFMAFGMVIIYGGAILVTYMFVIMLAAQAEGPAEVQDAPAYDGVAREPAAATAVGFLLLAVLLGAVFDDQSPRRPAAMPTTVQTAEQWEAHQRITQDQLIGELLPNRHTDQKDRNPLTNAEQVGLDLFRGHPLGIELAGVILLVALVGAVVIARMQVEKASDSDASQELTKQS